MASLIVHRSSFIVSAIRKGRIVRGVGIIGSGNMGSFHASRWQALPVALTGVYDSDPTRAGALAATEGGQALESVEALLNSSEIVDICTPPAEHATMTIAAAR